VTNDLAVRLGAVAVDEPLERSSSASRRFLDARVPRCRVSPSTDGHSGDCGGAAFSPGRREFMRRGVPDILFTGTTWNRRLTLTLRQGLPLNSHAMDSIISGPIESTTSPS
jgi:hypothetical protein